MNTQLPKPPKLAERFFRLYCNDDLIEEIEGDLLERFYDHHEAYGLSVAKRKYWINVFKFFKWHTIRRNRSKIRQNNIAIFQNYFKIALRNALRKKGYSLINVLGLVLGLSSFILIMLYTQHHLNFDKFHQYAQSIYRVNMGEHAITPNALSPLVKNNFPDELNLAVRGIRFFSRTFKLNGKIFLSEAYYADKDFLNMFSFQVLEGNKTTALELQNSLVLTRKEAMNLFGRIDILGEQIMVDDQPHQVTAVLENIPANSSLQFDFLVPLAAIAWTKQEVWNNASYFTFFQLAEGVNPDQFQKKFNRKVNEINNQEDLDKESFLLQPLANIHLQTDGKRQIEQFLVSDGKYIYIFSGVAISYC